MATPPTPSLVITGTPPNLATSAEARNNALDAAFAQTYADFGAADSAEASARAAGDSANAGAISAEALARADGDTANANAISAEAGARAMQGSAALIHLAAASLTASLASTTWTIGWTGLRGRRGAAYVEVTDTVAPLVVGGSFAAVIDVTGASPYTATVEPIDNALRAALEAGTKVALILNRAGAISGVLAGHARTVQAVGAASPPVPAETLRGRVTAGTGPVETLSTGQARSMLSVDRVDNVPDNAKPMSALVARVIDRPVRHPRWVAGLLANLGIPLLVFDRRSRAAVSELELWADSRSIWVGGIKTVTGKVLLGFSRRGEGEMTPGPAMIEAIQRGLIARPEPQLSSAQIISDTAETIGGHSVRRIVAERGGVTRLHTRRTDIVTGTMIAWGDYPLEYTAGAGQSNSVGGGFGPAGHVHTPAPVHPAQVLMFNGGARGTGGAAVPPADLTDFVPMYEIGVATQGETQGSGGLAWAVREAARRGQPLVAGVFRSHGQGGTAIADLTRGSVPYANGLAEVTAAVAAAACYGRVLRANRIWWDQGEADRNSLTAAEYQAALEALIGYYNEDWGAVLPGGNGAIHLYVTQLAASIQGGAGNASLGQLAAARANPLIHISTPNYVFRYIDNVHKIPIDHAHAGEYQMRAARWQEASGNWTGLRPASVARTGAVITITFDVPEGGLEFSTDILPAAPHWGFHFADDSASASIRSVEITAPDAVTITLTGTPVGANPRISYAHDSGAPAISGRAREWGNLVSRSADPSYLYPTRTLDHYCQIFQEPV